MFYQPNSLALLTDLYQLTMAYGFWKTGMVHKEAVFHHFFRKSPFHGGFAVAAGLESVIDYIENFSFNDSDIKYLNSLNDSENKPLFEPEFLDYLQQLKLSVSIDAVPEGTVCFPFAPLLRIQGPLIQCQLLESAILNQMNFPTLIATKASRLVIAAHGDPILEFGLRRAQGIDGALTASRSAYVGGVDATSNVLAGKVFGIPVRGTHAHSWVMAFDTELESFAKYAEVLPANCVFLVDTYDTIEGVKHAIEIGKILASKGHKLLGIRLDSGDLSHLSIQSRKLLNESGFQDTLIYASNELDESIVADLKRQGAQINCWGVGTSLVTGREQPNLDGVYKLSAIRNPGEPWEYKIKLSEQFQKISNPGILQVKRFFNEGIAVADVIYDLATGIEEFPEFIDPLDATKRKKIDKGLVSEDLLKPIFKSGKRVYDKPPLAAIRNNTLCNLAQFPKEIKRFLNPQQYRVGLEGKLHKIKLNLIDKIRLPKEGI